MEDGFDLRVAASASFRYNSPMLYHFQITLSDIDRGKYETIDFRLNQHPSETGIYLLTRALAYTLSHQQDLELSATGLADPELPAIFTKDPMGGYKLWIEIGNPSPKKLHKASKAAKQVEIYTYKNPDLIVKEVAQENVHRAEQIAIHAFDSKFLEALEKDLKKKNTWSLLYQEGHIDLDTAGQVHSTDVRKMQAR